MLDLFEKFSTYADFGEIVGVFFFIAVAIVVSLIKKLSEKAAQAEARRTQETMSKQEDLPEATRRMVYGEDIPTAKPRQAIPMGQRTAVPPPPVPTPTAGRPIELNDLLESLTGVRIQTERPEPQVPAEKRVLTHEQRVMSPETRPQTAGRTRREDAPASPQGRMAQAPQQKQQQHAAKPAQRRAQPVMKPGPQRNVIEEERLRAMQGAARRGTTPTSGWVAQALQRSDNARKAVTLLEVLGPPRALRDYQESWQL